MIIVNGRFLQTSNFAIGPPNLQRGDRVCFPKAKMGRGGVLGIIGVTRDDGQDLFFYLEQP